MSAGQLLSGLVVACSLLASPAWAQADYPNKSIRMIVGLAPGGLADQTARLIAPSLSKTLGQSVVVENRAGANGALAARQVADSAPDGYTLMVVLDGTLVIGAALGTSVGFDPVKDFTPIARIIDTPMTVVANPKVPASNLAELVALSKKAGSKELFYGSAGTGSSGHLVGEYLKQLTGLKMSHVPYKGAADATTDTVSGQIDMIISSASTTLPFVEAGQLKLVAVTGDKPLPKVTSPLAKDSGLPELKSFNVQAWAGLVGPPNMPEALVRRLHAAVQTALSDPDVVSRFAVVSASVASGSSADFGKQIAREAQQWQEVVTKGNLKTQ